MRLISLRLFAMAMVALVAQACHTEQRPTVVFLTADGPIPVQVEIVSTPGQRARGLMWRDRLGTNEGMLFVFPDSRRRGFWMKNTPLSLDIVFVGANRRIVSIAEHTTPYSTDPIPSRGPVRYVIEINAGFCRRHGITSGTRVQLPSGKIGSRPSRSAGGK